MSHYIKLILAAIAAMTLVAGCSSNTKKEEVDTSATEVGETVQEVVEEVTDPLEGVAKVFYFEFDSAVLNAAARSALLVHAEVLKDTGESVRLEGHADERGSREYNMALGERRANAVRDFLVLQGVSGSAIETVSYGEERPAAFGSNETSWAENRRVELK